MTEWTGYRLRKAKCKFKPNLALAWRTSADPVVLWSASFGAVPWSINSTKCILPTTPFHPPLPPSQGGMYVGEYGQGALLMFQFIR